MLFTLFKTSSSEVISIRSAFCLIIALHSNTTYPLISSWFDKHWNVTVEKRYNILLQQTLYKIKDTLFDVDVEEIIEHMQAYSTELLHMFVMDLYNYLCNKRLNIYLSDLVPNYVNLALEFIKKNSILFLSTVKKSSFGEEKFKDELYLCFYHTNEPIDQVKLVELYAAFGVFTVELIDMLKWIPEHMWNHPTWIYLDRIQQVLGRDVIEELFQLLDLVASNTNSKCCFYLLKILIQLVQANVVSLLEVYQRVSLIINNIPYYDDYEYSQGGKDIFDLLLNMSSIKKISSSIFTTELITKNDIDEKFKREFLDIQKKSFLFLRRNYLITYIQSRSSDFN
jgi:hypothetical protein